MEHRTIYEMFRHVASRKPEGTAGRYKSGGEWHDVSWAEHEATTLAISKALLALGVEKGDRVCILSQTRIEWVQSDFGIVSCGAVTVGVYPSNLAPDCAYILNHCAANVLIVEDEDQLNKILSVRGDLPDLKHIVRIDGPAVPESGVLSWKEFLGTGASVPDADLEARAGMIDPDDLASLVYTSGTTGVPKGAMITHRNLLFTSGSVSGSLLVEPHFVMLLFLPLAHVFARLIVYVCTFNAVTIAYAESIQKVPDNLKEIQPEFIVSVPRIYEKVYDRITSGVEEVGGVKAKLFHWAVGVGRQVSVLQQAKRPIPGMLGLKHKLATKLVLGKIQAAFGGRLVYAISGAAPMNKDIAEFFHACGIYILEGLGMTENTSFSNVNRFDNNKFGTVGPTGPGIEMKLAEDGEVLFRGDNVVKGYYRDPEGTAETFGSDGWLYTGDIGEIDEDGFLRITDRKKDIIVTAGGKNVAPQRIERILRTSHYIAQAVAIGDKRQFISALVTLDPDSVPAWAKSKGIAFGSVEDLASNSEVMKLIEAEVEDKNGQLASFESVKKFRLLPRDLSIEAGELTPTLKIKRKVVLEKFGDLVDGMYA
jgi:long-chain acyl-CoA synthetase